MLALLLGLWGRRSPRVRRLCSYVFAILVMVYICSLGSVLVFGRIPGKGYLVPAAAFLGGGLLGIITGVPLGRLAVGSAPVYWTLVALVAGVIAWLKPLF